MDLEQGAGLSSWPSARVHTFVPAVLVHSMRCQTWDVYAERPQHVGVSQQETHTEAFTD